MSRSVHRPWVRLSILAALALLGGMIGTRPASAMGCHTPDRPSLAFTFHRELIPDGPAAAQDIGPERPESRVSPQPCTGDVPGTSPDRPLALSAVVMPAGTEGAPAAEGRIAPDMPGMTPHLAISRLDRPPRLAL